MKQMDVVHGLEGSSDQSVLKSMRLIHHGDLHRQALHHAKMACLPSDALTVLYQPGRPPTNSPFGGALRARYVRVDAAREIEYALDGRCDKSGELNLRHS
jgi:hypothetical protein